MVANVGILGLGVYLPPQVRRNDWWPPDLVARWMEERRRAGPPPVPEQLTEGQRCVLQALGQQALDPFQGAVERRILSDDKSALDMEEQAARAAIADAGIGADAIDLVLTNTVVPDFMLGNPACSLHERLGLVRTCVSMHCDVPSYAFLMQLTLAEAMIAAGRARCALLVQSSVASRLLPVTDSNAPFFGDAATAVIMGRVSADRGIESAVHFTDGRYPRTIIMSVPGRRWYDEGKAMLHVGDVQQTQRLFLETADLCKESVDAALASARRAHGDIGVLGIHQGTPWLRRVVQEYTGLAAARSVETFMETAYIFACTLPLALSVARQEGLLRADDLVLLTGGGGGMTYGATVIRWGT